MTESSGGRIDSVCVMHALIPDRNPSGLEFTAIDNRPVLEPVHAGFLGLEGDDQFDKQHHGGLEQAVYVYATEEADRWSAELGYDVRPGQFGENLRTLGLAVTDVVVGERWQIGASCHIHRKVSKEHANWVFCAVDHKREHAIDRGAPRMER